MRNINEIPVQFPLHLDAARDRASSVRTSEVDALSAELEANGIVVLPNLPSSEQLLGMQQAFEARLRRVRWNNFDGYHKTERFRHMIEDVLVLDQGFLDLALHPLVKQILNRYLGHDYELTEAKGWKSLPTKRDFHGWHGDAWYDQNAAKEVHREIKLAMYLTDVHSGAFNFVKGSHRQQHPRLLKNDEVKTAQIFEVKGPAGTAFLFDTSGIHRQGVPMLETRQALFYNYHDPKVRLQHEDLITYRYHPLLLNAAFLENLSDEDRRILGFGNKTNFVPAFVRHDQPPLSYNALCLANSASLVIRELRQRMAARLRRTFRTT
jgi:Phytanoyl-CoA dioxygenase (PhyH)